MMKAKKMVPEKMARKLVICNVRICWWWWYIEGRCNRYAIGPRRLVTKD